MSATKNECNQGSPSIYRPEANAWISKRSSDLDYKGVFALIKIGFLQSSFLPVPRFTETIPKYRNETEIPKRTIKNIEKMLLVSKCWG